MTRQQLELLELGAGLKSNDMNFFFFTLGIFIAGLTVVTTTLPSDRVVADAWIIATIVTGLFAAYTGIRARIGAGMVAVVMRQLTRD